MRLTFFQKVPLRALPIVVLACAVAMRCLSFLHDDVSWLITIAEHFLAGEQAYVDIIDVNPPASFLIYTPQVALASFVGVSSESIVILSTFLLAIAATCISGAILRPLGLFNRSAEPWFATLSFCVLLVLCGDVFAQREHFALMGLLPLLACYVARAYGHAPNRFLCIFAGLGGCLALVIKPHFALAIGLPLLFVAWKKRKDTGDLLRSLLSPENLITAAGATGYLAAVFVFFPVYIKSIVPMALDVYGPVRLSVSRLFVHTSTWAIIGSTLFAFGMVRGEIRKSEHAIMMLSGFGSAISYFIQAKGWAYHAYPAVAMFLFASGVALINDIFPRLQRLWPSRTRILATCVFIALIPLIAADLLWAHLPLVYPPVFHSVMAFAPPHPTVIGISDNMAGPQMARLVGGRWVGRLPNQAIKVFAEKMAHTTDVEPQTAKRLASYVVLDEQILVERLRNAKPDVVLIATPDLQAWALSAHNVSEELAHYHKADSVDDTDIWIRTISP